MFIIEMISKQKMRFIPKINLLHVTAAKRADMQNHTKMNILTPCVNTAEFPCSSISSSSSSVVARPVISSCRCILLLHLSRQSVCVRLYSVITSTNLRDKVECCVFLILRSADDLFECSSCSIFCSMSVNSMKIYRVFKVVFNYLLTT